MCPAIPVAAAVIGVLMPRSKQIYIMTTPANPEMHHSPINSMIENGCRFLLILLM